MVDDRGCRKHGVDRMLHYVGSEEGLRRGNAVER